MQKTQRKNLYVLRASLSCKPIPIFADFCREMVLSSESKIHYWTFLCFLNTWHWLLFLFCA